MAVISAAIAAVSIAAAVTTAATVASAVVAVSTLVATVGLAVTAVGMVTGNKDIMKVGNIMGMVGLAGGIAGLGMGAIASASAAAPSVANQFANPQLAASITGGIEQAGKVGAGSVLAPATAQAARVGAGSVLAPAGSGVLSMPSVTPVTTSSATIGLSPSPVSSAPGVPTPAASVTSAPGAPMTVAPSVSTVSQTLGQAPPVGDGGSKVQGFWDRLPDWQKAQLTVTGGQALSGLAGGFFEGLSAEERLEFDQLINSQTQAQRELTNRNNAYAPTLSFQRAGSGLLATGGR